MLAKVCSAAVNGIEAYPGEVELNAGYKLKIFHGGFCEERPRFLQTTTWQHFKL